MMSPCHQIFQRKGSRKMEEKWMGSKYMMSPCHQIFHRKRRQKNGRKMDGIEIYDESMSSNISEEREAEKWKKNGWDRNGRRPKWKTTEMEDHRNGRRPKWKTTEMEDDQNGRRPKWKTSKMEDD